MASAVTLKTYGDWAGGVKIPLEQALQYSVSMVKGNGIKALRQAVFFMAQSAGAIARSVKTKARRKVSANPEFAHLLRKEQYEQVRRSGRDMARYYRFTADKLRQGGKPAAKLYANQRKRISKIGRRRLLADSWMWGFNKRTKNKTISGIARLFEQQGKDPSPRGAAQSQMMYAVILNMSLSYITKAMPTGWKSEVERRAINRIFGKHRKAIEGEWQRNFRAGATGLGKIADTFRSFHGGSSMSVIK